MKNFVGKIFDLLSLPPTYQRGGSQGAKKVIWPIIWLFQTVSGILKKNFEFDPHPPHIVSEKGVEGDEGNEEVDQGEEGSYLECLSHQDSENIAHC